MIDGQQKDDSKTPPEKDDATKNNPNKLSPEEQLALYEEQLKEEDWGHQPC